MNFIAIALYTVSDPFDYWEITQRTWKKFRDGDFYLAKYYIDDVPNRWFTDSPREKLRAFFCLDSDKEKWLTNTETVGEIVLLAAKEKGCSSVDELMKSCGQWMKKKDFPLVCGKSI